MNVYTPYLPLSLVLFDHLGICSMNYNFLYEKIYMILYIMTVCLMVLSSIQVIAQTLLMLSPELRVIWVKSTLGNKLSAKEIDIAIDSYPQFVLLMLIWNSFIEPKERGVRVIGIKQFCHIQSIGDE